MAFDKSGPPQSSPRSQKVFIPSAGDILWCLAPYKPRDMNAAIVPGDKPHPVLVLTVYDQLDPVELLIVPGTGTLGGPFTHLDFEIEEDSVDGQHMGLTKTTRFKISGIDRIPYRSDLFIFPNLKVQSCKTGRATDNVIRLAREKYEELIKHVQKARSK